MARGGRFGVRIRFPLPARSGRARPTDRRGAVYFRAQLSLRQRALWRPIQSDDYDLRYFDCDTVYTGINKPFFALWYYQTGHYAGYDLVGRTEVEPMPVDPDFKITNRLWLFLLGPELAPQNERGTSLLRYRYAEPTHRSEEHTSE